jgi:acyl-CoA thioesterase-1
MKAPWMIVMCLCIWFAKSTSAIAEAEKITIVALGDSLTEGYQLNKTQAYPAQLERLLQEKGRDVRVVNQGISGDTSAGGRARVQRVIDADPNIAIVALGPNDFLRGLPPSSTRANLEHIVKTLTKAGINVILVGFNAAPNIGPVFQERFNSIFSALKEAYPITVTYDFLTGVAGDADLNLDDGIHPNAEGYKIVAQNLLPILENVITQKD